MTGPEPSAIRLSIRAPLRREDLPGLCRRVGALFDASRGSTALCDVAEVVADAVAVDALARLQVVARKRGCLVRLRGASAELRDLVAFMGLDDVLTE